MLSRLVDETMNMSSFVVTIGEFLKMHRVESPNFDQDRSNYVIPKYQREYKWNDERVYALIADIKNRDKFLGNVIINKVGNYYEIVDGQQRITTIILILIALFNRNKNPQNELRSEEQKNILNYLLRENKFILGNESIGEYIFVNENSIDIRINAEDDIYFQKGTFESLYNIIASSINHAEDGVRDTELLNFQNKVLDCQVLVLIGEPNGRQQDSIEEVFLDINFKSQLLDVANIFKGYCFKNYSATSHEELKDQWATIRSHTKQFEKRFGYEENRETCEYLYLYLLSMPESYKIPANLSCDGKHYLEEKNHTQTKEILIDMVDYGTHIIAFNNELLNLNYFFADLCCDAIAHKDEMARLQSMKAMALITLESKAAQYYKLPFLMFIHLLQKVGNPDGFAAFLVLKSIITNFYIYAFLFSNSGKQKNKSLIAYDLLDILHSQDSVAEKTEKILAELKTIRKDFLEGFALFRAFNPNKAYAFYSIMDHYVANTNFIEYVYSRRTDYTPEHLLVHDNSSMKVIWKDEGNEFSFSLKELLGKPDGKNYKGTAYKKQTTNYLILPKPLNEALETNDIISKIFSISNYYSQREVPLPKHISVLLEHIQEMQTYKDLAQLKDSHTSQDAIKNKYKLFINDYFEDENQARLYAKMESKFKEAFQN